jgi:hypothetical protein
MKIQIKENFVFIWVSLSLLLSIGLYFLFQYSNNELAGKTCLIVTHQLQSRYKESQGSFTSDLDELKRLDAEIKNPRKPEEKIDGIDPRCVEHFKLHIVKADSTSFEARVITERSHLSISEKGQVSIF